jgi:hypothetical protein
MKSPEGIAHWLVERFAQRLVANRPATVPGRSVMNVNSDRNKY